MRVVTLILLLGMALLFSPPAAPAAQARAALTEQEKILHLLNRIGYGPRPGDIEKVRKIGIRAYIDQQLHPETLPDTVAQTKLREFKALGSPETNSLDVVV